MRLLIILALCAIGGCLDSTTYLKNEKTGQVVTCGGSHVLSYTEAAIQRREALCIEDYRQQGYVRVPKP